MAGNRVPARDGDAPLHELPRDPLSVFLFLALTGKELGDLVRDMGITIPGFRTERLSDAERADALADEIRAVPSLAKPVLEAMRKIYEFPALDFVELTPLVAKELGALAIEEDAPVRILWRLLADPSKDVRATARPILEEFVKELYGPAERSEAARPSKTRSTEADPAIEIAKFRKAAERAQEDTAGLKRRVDDLKEDLRVARAEASEARRAASADRKAREAIEKKAAKTVAPVAKPGAGSMKAALKEAESAKHLLAAAEKRAIAAEAERGVLQEEIETLGARLAAQPAAPLATADDDEPAGAPPATWLMPRFSREFYDSLKGWEPRVVRTAFKQAFLLAENHRHPSLRAIPLEGVPGFYRVRVMTDVRLIYKRVEREVEILSVIDREDLDRYVREAKTR